MFEDFFSNICYTITFYGTIIKDEVVKQSLQTIDYLKNYNYNDLLLNAFLLYCKIVFLIQTKSKKIYNDYPFIRQSVNSINYSIKCIQCFLLNSRIEPSNDNWISIASLNLSYYDRNVYYYNDTYFFRLPENENDVFNQLKQWHDITKNIVFVEANIVECLIVMNVDNKYIYKICNKNNYELTNNHNFEISRVRFLTVEYITKNKIITLELNKNIYYVGNEILSSVFIKRLLEYQVNSYSFDMDYTLKIIDNNIDTFVLKNNEYILLEKNGYSIICY
jgi:hypothetical protein